VYQHRKSHTTLARLPPKTHTCMKPRLCHLLACLYIGDGIQTFYHEIRLTISSFLQRRLDRLWAKECTRLPVIDKIARHGVVLKIQDRVYPLIAVLKSSRLIKNHMNLIRLRLAYCWKLKFVYYINTILSSVLFQCFNSASRANMEMLFFIILYVVCFRVFFCRVCSLAFRS